LAHHAGTAELMRPIDRSSTTATSSRPAHREAVIAAIAVLAVAAAYAFVSAGLRLGPIWLLPLLTVSLLVLVLLARLRGRHALARRFRFAMTALATLAVGGSVAVLVVQLVDHRLPGTQLLRDGAILWGANVVVFALWYWELDGGGPGRRHGYGYSPTDFLFPQIAAGGDLARTWCPHFVDYLFVAFTTSTAFSPTDTLPLSERVKLLMMAQALVSIVTVGVVIARAVNTLR
jgi:hypothetical protein